MALLVDTSALYARLDPDDKNHRPATATFVRCAESSESLVAHSYAVAEAVSIVQARLGVRSVRTLVEDLLAPVEIVWVDEELHRAGIAALLAAGRRQVSLVDWVSFELMRRRGIETAFAFDRDFARHGFRTIP